MVKSKLRKGISTGATYQKKFIEMGGFAVKAGDVLIFSWNYRPRVDYSKGHHPG
jgi:hypothetical protein